MLQVLIDNGNGPVDYTSYVISQSITITDSINVPALLNLQLSNNDEGFVAPKQSSYITVYSLKYDKYLFTGFITNEPERSYLGRSGKIPSFGFQSMQYVIQASSDEWLLNVKAIPFIPAFVNQTMGQILASLADQLAPGFFDTSLIQDGDIVPYFLYDPTQKWSDLAKTFADSALFRYQAINRQITFAPYGDNLLGISYDDTGPDSSFAPGGLKSNVLTVPPVNTAIVIGDVEPQQIHADYFIGNGFDANFQLRHQMFNGSTNLLLQDDWTEPSFNASYWTVQDPQDMFLLAGALNAIGGTGQGAGGQVYTDTFNRANENPLSVAGPWSTFGPAGLGPFTVGQILSQGFTSTNIGRWSAYTYTGGVFSPDQSAQVTFHLLQGGAAGGVLLRADTGANGYLCQWEASSALGSTGNVQVFPIVAGIPQLAVLTVLGVTFNTDDIFKAQIVGSTITVYKNGSLLGTGTDSTFTTGRPGIVSLAGNGADGNLRNWIAGGAGDGTPLGQEYILANNGLELGGHLTLQHGLFTFTDVNLGLIGGVYKGFPLDMANSLLAFQTDVAVGDTFIPSPSGATNLSLSGLINVAVSGAASVTGSIAVTGATAYPLIKTLPNHQYLLTTRIDAKRWTRYNQIYRTLDSTVLGAQYLPSIATVTFSVSDYDQTVPFNPPTVTQIVVPGVSLPSFGLYALLNMQQASLSTAYTLLSQPPQGILSVANLIGPTGASLPILPSQIETPKTYPLGFGMQIATATITSAAGGSDQASTLAFYTGFIPYTNDIPSAGARISFESWEAGKAIAYVQNTVAVSGQALVQGDDGVRTAIFADLQPLPRTSEEAEWAGVAQVIDRSNTQWQGTYSVFDYFWDSTLDYPVSGRYLYCNSPQRNIHQQNFLAQSVTTRVVEMFGETLSFEIGFGQDLFLEKLIRRFLPTPKNILEPNETAVQPTLQHINNVGMVYLQDLSNTVLTSITGTSVTVDCGAGIPFLLGQSVEVRKADFGWGGNDNNLIGRFSTQIFTLTRGAYEQVWYLRFVGDGMTSRFTKVIRVVYPQIPTAPRLSGVDDTTPTAPIVQLEYSGDIRNIRGVEIRDFDNTTVLRQQTVISNADLNITYNNQFNFTTIRLYAYFFNLMWEYSAPLIIEFNIGNPLTSIEQAGPNLLANPGFELLTGNYVPSLIQGTGNLIAQAWTAITPTQFGAQTLTNSNARTGQRYGNIAMMLNASVANGATLTGAVLTLSGTNPLVSFPVRGGDYYYFGGSAQWQGPALPANVVGNVYFQLNFYDSSGNFVDSIPTSTELGAPTSTWTFLDAATNVPQQAAFVVFGCYIAIQNNSGSVFNTGATTYLIANFDDTFLFLATRNSHSSYRPLSNPLTAKDDGAYTEIDIASFIMRAGTTDVGYSSGAITTLAHNTLFYVYFDDPDFKGGATTYNATTTKEIALLGESRFFVGSIVTPVTGGQPTIGNNDGGPGAQNGMVNTLSMSQSIQNGSLYGLATINNAQLAVDGNIDSFASLIGVGAASGTAGAGGVQETRRPTAFTNPATGLGVVVAGADPSNAFDSSFASFATVSSSVPLGSSFQETAATAWHTWQSASGSYSALSIVVTAYGNCGSTGTNGGQNEANLQYSIDGGIGFADFFDISGDDVGNTSTLPATSFSASIPPSTPLSNIQIRAIAFSSSDLIRSVHTQIQVKEITTVGVLGSAGSAFSAGAAQLLFSGPPGITRRYFQATLKALIAVSQNSLNAGTGVAFFTYSTDIYRTTNTTLFTIDAGITTPLVLLEIALPQGLNLSQIQAVAGIQTGPAVSGTVELDVYEVWIEAIE